MDKKRPWFVVTRIDERRESCVKGHGRRNSCAFRRMLIRLIVPSSGRNNAGSRLVRLVVSAMSPERLPPFYADHAHEVGDAQSTPSLGRATDDIGR